MVAKKKKSAASSIAVLFVFGLLLSGISVDKEATATEEEGGGNPIDTCADGIDNDQDGYTDGTDAECDTNSPYYDGTEDTPDDQLGGGGPPP